MTKDLGSAVRSLRRAPAFTGLVVLTLALGIGGTTAMFSVVDAVLLNPLPVPHAERFMEVWTNYPGTRQPGASTAVIEPLRDSGLFSSVEAYQFGTVVLTGNGDPDNVTSPEITRGLLDVMGAAPLLGRLFQQEDIGGERRVALISARLWRSRFGGDANIINREITLDDRPTVVVGVLSERFRFPERNVDIWRPLDSAATAKPRRAQIVVRRRPEVTRQQVDDRLRALSPGLRASGALGAELTLSGDVLLQQRFGRQQGSPFYILFGAVTLVLLVACVNVTNLLLVRSSVRHGELALRSALGAGRSDLLKPVLAENLLLAAAGGLAGLAVAKALLAAILALVPPQLTFLSNAASSELDWRALGFAAALSTGTCLIFGMLPAWRTSRVDAIDAVKQGSITTIGSRDDRWQGVLVSAQLALVLVLLAGSGLLLRSFTTLLAVDLGFDSAALSVVSLQFPNQRYGSPGRSLIFMQELERRVESRGDIRATFAGGAPPRFGGITFLSQLEGEGGLPVNLPDLELPFQRVAGDYFETMGTAIIEGRSFIASDRDEATIVSEGMGRRLWGETSPIGRRVRWSPKDVWRTVVGVARDVKAMGPSDPMGEGMEQYLPFLPERNAGSFAFIIRAGGNRAAALQFVREQIWAIDNKLPIGDATSMDDRIGESVARPRFFLGLTAAFAVTAVLLAIIGVYGISTYWVTRRRRELAIRVALGASRENIMAMVIRRSLKLAAAGGVIGVALAVAGARTIESLLFATNARDPLTLVGVTVMLAALAVLACTFPALKASRVDPMSVLRAE